MTRFQRLGRTCALLFISAGCSAPSFHGVVLEPAERAPELGLTDSSGERFDFGEQKGRVVLVFFGYTHCPDVCPTTLVDWKRAADSLGKNATNVRFVFVSVDPERDTPALTQRYVARFSPSFLGLTGTRPQIDALMAAWRVASYRDGVPGDTSAGYTISHPSQVFVVDGAGQLRLLHRAGLTPAQISADIRALL